jgi:hypothetical protein
VETISIIASGLSIGVGVLAVLLAIIFYRMSKEENAKIKEVNDKISNNITNLEMLLNNFHSNTFVLLRDIVADLRKHAWPEVHYIPLAQTGTEISSLVKEVPKEEIARIVKEQKVTYADTDKKWDEIQKIIVTAFENISNYIKKNKPMWAKKAIISMIGEEGTIAQYLFSDFLKLKKFEPKDFFDAVYSLKEEGILGWDGNRLEPDTVIKIKKKTWKYL